MIIDCVGADPADDDVCAAVAVDGFRAGARRDRVRSRGADDRQTAADRRGVHIREALNRSQTAGRLVGGVGEIQVDRCVEVKGSHPGSRADFGFAAVIIDEVRARAAKDDVRSAVAIDRLRAGARGNRVRGSRTHDRKRRGDGAGVHIRKVRDNRSSRDLICGMRQIHAVRDSQIERAGAGAAVNRRFVAVIIDEIRA